MASPPGDPASQQDEGELACQVEQAEQQANELLLHGNLAFWSEE